jgi:hypothetical protein
MDYTSIKVGQLPTGEISGGNFIPHEVAGVLKKATFTDLAAFIGANDAVGFRAVSVQNGGTLPTTDTQEFILVGPGTYNNVGGGSTITVTEELNALVSNGTYWFVGVEIPIDAPPGNAIWGQIIGTLSNQTDLKNILDLKADLVDGKVPASQLPSYVDDIIEVANFAALPATGETGKIYLTLDNNKIYRWSGSIYIEIAAENAVWGQIVGTLSNQTDLQSALNAKVPYTGATANVDLGTHTLSSKNLVVNHASGSGVAAQITKGGNGEALTVSKSSGTGNAASILGGVTLLSELHLNTSLADTYIASAATWNAKQNALSGTGFVKISGTTISYDNNTYALDSAVVKLTGDQDIRGVKSFLGNQTASTLKLLVADYFNDGFITSDNGMLRLLNGTTELFKLASNGNVTANSFIKSGGTSSQYLKADGSVSTLVNPITGTGTTNYVSKFTGTGTLGNSLIFDDSTNLGIGTTTLVSYAGYTTLTLNNSNSGGVLAVRRGTSGLNLYASTSGGHFAGIDATKSLIFETADLERMRITSGGELCIGTTTAVGSGLANIKGAANVYNLLAIQNTFSGGGNFAYFINPNGTQAGAITNAGGGAVYSSVSDYRLKEDFKNYNALNLISKIKTYDYKLKSYDLRMYGVKAHELQQVVPYAVIGEKDAKEMQSVDYSKLVPILVKAVQELKAEIEILKNK